MVLVLQVPAAAVASHHVAVAPPLSLPFQWNMKNARVIQSGRKEPHLSMLLSRADLALAAHSLLMNQSCQEHNRMKVYSSRKEKECRRCGELAPEQVALVELQLVVLQIAAWHLSQQLVLDA
jgi:hypothetical protein